MANSAFKLGGGTAAGATGVIVQSVTTISANPADSAGAIIPLITTPQITDGAMLNTVTITPKKTNNELVVRFSCPISAHEGTGCTVFSLFKVGTNDALTSTASSTTAGNVDAASLEYRMSAGTTSPITFQIRFGVNPGSGGSAFVLQTIPAQGAGAYTFGGALQYSLNVTEIDLSPGAGGGAVPALPGATTYSEARAAGTASGTGGFSNGIYTTPAGVTSLVVTLVGAGGGAALGISGEPTTAAAHTTFGYLSAYGGGEGRYGIADGFPPVGGTGGTTAGVTNGTAIVGNPGTAQGDGGIGFLGAGAGADALAGGNNGGGGGAGGVILEETIASPAATYAYKVGASSNWFNGSYVGQNGCIIVSEYY